MTGALALVALDYHANGLRKAPTLTRTQSEQVSNELRAVSALFAELLESADAVSASLAKRIDAANAMAPQAVMTRRLVVAVSAVKGSKL